jgi:hypothetical protein
VENPTAAPAEHNEGHFLAAIEEGRKAAREERAAAHHSGLTPTPIGANIAVDRPSGV